LEDINLYIGLDFSIKQWGIDGEIEKCDFIVKEQYAAQDLQSYKYFGANSPS